MHARGPDRTVTGLLHVGLALVLLCGCERSRQGQMEARRKAPSSKAMAERAQPPPEPAASSGETFGDTLWVQLPVPGFDALPLRDRTLLFHFQQVLLAGRDMAFAQRFEDNLDVRHTLETVLETYRGNRDTGAFEQLETYAGRFFASVGVHHPVSGAKLEPGFSASEFAALVQSSDARTLPLHPGQSVAAWLERLTPILFSPAVAPHLQGRVLGTDPFGALPPQLYDDVGPGEASAYYAGEAPTPRHPRNARLEKRGGQLVEHVYRVDGLYSSALERMVRALEDARAIADGSLREALDALITHFTTGEPEAFERYLARRRESEARVDLALGFLDPSSDPLGLKGTLAGVASFHAGEPNPNLTTLLDHAGDFESRLPLAKTTWQKRKHAVELRPMQAAIAGGSWSARPPGYVKLAGVGPRDDGHPLLLKNVVETRLTATPLEALAAELALGAREQRRAREHGRQAQALFADLRATLGHSAAPLPGESPDPHVALNPHADLLLEVRADLIALYALFDEQLIELGLMPSFEVARTQYDAYVRDALLTSLASLTDEAPPVDPGVLAARLVVQWARAQDPAESPTVQRVLKEGTTYFVIGDYFTLRRRFGQLMAEVQRILAQGDREAAARLVREHAEPVESVLRKQVHERLASLELPSVVGLVQPRLVADYEGPTIRDVRLHYPTGVLAQALADSRAHATLPGASE